MGGYSNQAFRSNEKRSVFHFHYNPSPVKKKAVDYVKSKRALLIKCTYIPPTVEKASTVVAVAFLLNHQEPKDICTYSFKFIISNPTVEQTTFNRCLYSFLISK